MSIIFQKLYDENGIHVPRKRPVIPEKNRLGISKKSPDRGRNLVVSVLKQFKFLITD